MKKLSAFLTMVLVLVVMGTADASLTTIGTATYNGSDYNLIYEDNSLNGGLVWLDYTRSYDTWQNQMNWASGLGSNLTVNLNSGYTTDIDWGTGWRLPITDESQCNLSAEGWGYEGPDATGYHDYWQGYNMVNSEMGHLYYESLGNLGQVATDGTRPQTGWGLQNIGDFKCFTLYAPSIPWYYWSGTLYSPNPSGHDGVQAWGFCYHDGAQGVLIEGMEPYALAVHPGTVNAVPIPSAVWLLGSGLIGLVGFRRKLKK